MVVMEESEEESEGGRAVEAVGEQSGGGCEGRERKRWRLCKGEVEAGGASEAAVS